MKDHDFPLQQRAQIGKAIQRLRLDRELQQRDLAKALDKSVGTVSLIESGKHPLDYLTLITIGKKLGVHPLRLIWDAEKSSPSRKPGLDLLAPVFDALLERFEEIDAEAEAKPESRAAAARPSRNGSGFSHTSGE